MTHRPDRIRGLSEPNVLRRETGTFRAFQSAAVKLPAVLNRMLPACGGVTRRSTIGTSVGGIVRRAQSSRLSRTVLKKMTRNLAKCAAWQPGKLSEDDAIAPSKAWERGMRCNLQL